MASTETAEPRAVGKKEEMTPTETAEPAAVDQKAEVTPTETADPGAEGARAGVEAKGKEKEVKPEQDAGPDAAAPVPKAPPLAFPKTTVKRIMKLGQSADDSKNVSGEALHLIGKASEVFLGNMALKSFEWAKKEGRRTIRYQDVSDVRVRDPNLVFLEAVIPAPGEATAAAVAAAGASSGT